jgi:hypothetical protein
MKCQFSDSNKNIKNWNVHFFYSNKKNWTEILILKIRNNNLELKFRLLNQIFRIQISSFGFN